jgi:hypothetical protein
LPKPLGHAAWERLIVVSGVAGDDDEVEGLYALAPGEFVAARDGLAKRLQQAGDKDRAKAVKALRRPTVAAWAVNQLARRHRQELGELLDLGERLRRAQAQALGGRGAGTLKELLAERRAAVERVARLAVAELGDSGGAQRDAIVATLEAALADPDDAEAVRAGRLSKELLAPSGFGVGVGVGDGGLDDGDGDDGDQVTSVEGERSAASEPDVDVDQERQRRRAQREVDEKRGALRTAKDELDAATREVEAADGEVARLEALVAGAKERARVAADRRRLAERRIAPATDALADAERALDQLTGGSTGE